MSRILVGNRVPARISVDTALTTKLRLIQVQYFAEVAPVRRRREGGAKWSHPVQSARVAPSRPPRDRALMPAKTRPTPPVHARFTCATYERARRCGA
jgi:hypothetical protein